MDTPRHDKYQLYKKIQNKKSKDYADNNEYVIGFRKRTVKYSKIKIPTFFLFLH